MANWFTNQKAKRLMKDMPLDRTMTSSGGAHNQNKGYGDSDGPPMVSKGAHAHKEGHMGLKEVEETTEKNKSTHGESRARVAAQIKEQDASRQSFKTSQYRKGTGRLKVNDQTGKKTNMNSGYSSGGEVAGAAGSRLTDDGFGGRTSVVKEKVASKMKQKGNSPLLFDPILNAYSAAKASGAGKPSRASSEGNTKGGKSKKGGSDPRKKKTKPVAHTPNENTAVTDIDKKNAD